MVHLAEAPRGPQTPAAAAVGTTGTTAAATAATAAATAAAAAVVAAAALTSSQAPMGRPSVVVVVGLGMEAVLVRLLHKTWLPTWQQMLQHTWVA